MKQFIILFTLSLTIFSGCSSHFEHYTLTSENEKATTSYQNIRLLGSDNKTKAVISTIYLNDVYPNYTGGMAHFLVAFYNPQQENILYFTRNEAVDESSYLLLLNGEEALASEPLDNDDLLVELMPVSNNWSRYYYVRYKLPSGQPVLVLESGHTEQAVITYQKAQQ